VEIKINFNELFDSALRALSEGDIPFWKVLVFNFGRDVAISDPTNFRCNCGAT